MPGGIESLDLTHWKPTGSTSFNTLPEKRSHTRARARPGAIKNQALSKVKPSIHAGFKASFNPFTKSVTPFVF